VRLEEFIGGSDIHALLARSVPLASQFVDLNLGDAPIQSFPATPAAVAAAGMAGSVIGLFTCQDASGSSVIADSSGNGNDLTKNGSPLLSQRVVGVSDGSSMVTRKAAEFVYPSLSSQYFEAALAAFLDVDRVAGKQQRGLLVAFRAREQSAVTAALFAKGTFPNAGFGLYNDGAGTGTLSAQLRDTGGVHVASVATPSGGLLDGAIHWVYLEIDLIADTLGITTDVTTRTTTSTAALGNTTTTDKFRFGTWAGAGGAGAYQILYAVAFGDVATTTASIANWWKHANMPGGAAAGTSGITYNRASSLTAPVVDDATDGTLVATYKAGQFPFEYNALISTSAMKLGMPVDLGATNLIPNTDLNLGANWTTTGTLATYDNDSPRGFREAIKHTKTAGADKVIATAGNGASVTISQTYTASVYCRWDGVGTAPELRMYRADGTTQIGSTVSATDNSNKWRRLSLTFTAPASEAVRLAVSGAALASTSGSAKFDMPQINAGAYATSWILTKGGTASTGSPTIYATLNSITSDVVTMRAWFTARAQSSTSNRIIIQSASAIGSNTNERVAYINNTDNKVAFYDTSDNLFGGAPADWATVESMVTAIIDVASSLGFKHKIDRTPGSNAASDSTAPTAPTSNPYLYLGNRAAGGEHLGGVISKARLWRAAVAV
jgi:hypothetical protein